MTLQLDHVTTWLDDGRSALPHAIRSKGLRALIDDFSPQTNLGRQIREAVKFLPEELAFEIIDAIKSVAVVESSLSAKVFRGLGLVQAGFIPPQEMTVEDHGVVSRKVVTTVGAEFLVDAFQNTTEIENFKFHGIGTGGAAEAVGNTALTTELTTEYNPNSTRATGTQTENGSTVYRTVGTNTLDSGTPAITEHGIFSAASAGTLWDRSLFSAINLNGTNGDGLQTTYDLTITAGG